MALRRRGSVCLQNPVLCKHQVHLWLKENPECSLMIVLTHICRLQSPFSMPASVKWSCDSLSRMHWLVRWVAFLNHVLCIWLTRILISFPLCWTWGALFEVVVCWNIFFTDLPPPVWRSKCSSGANDRLRWCMHMALVLINLIPDNIDCIAFHLCDSCSGFPWLAFCPNIGQNNNMAMLLSTCRSPDPQWVSLDLCQFLSKKWGGETVLMAVLPKWLPTKHSMHCQWPFYFCAPTLLAQLLHPQCRDFVFHWMLFRNSCDNAVWCRDTSVYHSKSKFWVTSTGAWLHMHLEDLIGLQVLEGFMYRFLEVWTYCLFRAKPGVMLIGGPDLCWLIVVGKQFKQFELKLTLIGT